MLTNEPGILPKTVASAAKQTLALCYQWSKKRLEEPVEEVLAHSAAISFRLTQDAKNRSKWLEHWVACRNTVRLHHLLSGEVPFE